MAKHAIPVSGAPRRRHLASVRRFSLVAAMLAGLYLSYLLALPFLASMVWALTITVLAMPAHRRLERMIGRPNPAATVSVALLGFAVLLPLVLFGPYFAGVLSAGVFNARQQLASIDYRQVLDQLPILNRLDGVPSMEGFGGLIGNLGNWATDLASFVILGSVSNVITLLLTFYLLFYFLRDRRAILRSIKELSPFTTAETDSLFGKVSDTIYGVVIGKVVSAAVQGALGGLAFWTLGISNPVFWGLVMGLLSIVPVLGAFVVWIPAAAYLALSGQWGKAMLLTGFGATVIAMADNILYPVLAGGRLHQHSVVVLISILGGLMLFGPCGLVLGPLIVTITLAMLQIWRDRAEAPLPAAHEQRALTAPSRRHVA
jgi:predicted PurR-regulated permease PerM